MHNFDECPNCFEKLDGTEDVCPKCGNDLNIEKLNASTELARAEKTKKRIIFIIKIFTGLVIIAAAVIGKIFGNWWYALLGFGLGCVFTFLTIFVSELILHFKYTKPFSDDNVVQDKEEENSNDR